MTESTRRIPPRDPRAAALLVITTVLSAASAIAQPAPPSSARTIPPAVSAATSASLPAPQAADRRDRHSYANPGEARVTHVSLDLRADFGARVLDGVARLTVSRTSGDRLVLDTNGLAVQAVTTSTGTPLPFELAPADPVLGRALVVSLPRAGVTPASGPIEIHVRYRTSPDATALQWLSPAQTAGKKQPYLFSQGQAILTRSWIPTQDSPGIRQTYDARVVVPEGLSVVMSAERLTPAGERVDGGRAFRFRMAQPIPPYLFAIAIGDIVSREVGSRTAAFSEPSVVEAAAREFADLEKMVDAAERLYGPYRWGRYDVLVLPPSFPYGGMENPRMTFLTPTLLAGDRSLVSVVAHELAHSWSGNLVTNATWRDFWLNEGFTTYFELRIMEALYGVDRAAALESLERAGMMKELSALGLDNPATQLHLPDTVEDPDAGMSDLAYSKGSAFLRMLEHEVGRAPLDAYLNGYFERHAFSSLTTPEFAADLRQYLLRGDAARYESLKIDEWLYRPGLPANATPARSTLLERATQDAARYAAGGAVESLPAASWSTQEWVAFLDALPRSLPTARLATLDRAFGMSDRTNAEVLFAWLQLAIARHYEPAVPALERFLAAQGRRKFVQPLFEALMADDWGRPIARRVYAVAREGYHPVTAAALDRLIAQ